MCCSGAGYPRDQLPTFPADPMMSFMPFAPGLAPPRVRAQVGGSGGDLRDLGLAKILGISIKKSIGHHKHP